MSKPTLFDLLNEYSRDGIRFGESIGRIRKGLLDSMIIYEEFLFWRNPERRRPKCEIYDSLAERYGYSISSIRNKITQMADTNYPPEVVNEVKFFFLHLHLKEKHKQSAQFDVEESEL